MAKLIVLQIFLILFASAHSTFGQAIPNDSPFAEPSSAQLLLPSVRSLGNEWEVTGDIQYDTAITLAELSVLAYNDEHNRVLTLRLIGFDEVVPLDDGAMSGFLAKKNDLAVICFRGTDVTSPSDWMTNINLFRQQRMDRDLRFHKGFQDAYVLFSREVISSLKNWRPKKLWITGHSLGGAMAVCCAYDCLTKRIPVTGLVTFGQPRVANPSMAEYLNDHLGARYLRFINNGDIVPSVPTARPRFLSDYQHCGHSAWFNKGEIERDTRLMSASVDELFEQSNEPASVESVNQINAEQLNNLQTYLRETNSPLPRIAASIDGDYSHDPSDLFAEPPTVNPDNLSSQDVMEAQAFTNRFSDHSMLEYLRLLNEHLQTATP